VASLKWLPRPAKAFSYLLLSDIRNAGTRREHCRQEWPRGPRAHCGIKPLTSDKTRTIIVPGSLPGVPGVYPASQGMRGAEDKNEDKKKPLELFENSQPIRIVGLSLPR
jgi:hypothetical protein